MLHVLRVSLVTAIIFSAFALLQDGPQPHPYDLTQGILALGMIAIAGLALALLSETAINRRHSNIINRYYRPSHWYDTIPSSPIKESSGVIVRRRFE